jgi:tetratricopeptide (TPR) repeat protein
LERYPAVELFVQRARAIRPAFQLTDANAMSVVEICARLDGLPLALELAAARTRLFPPQALARRLSDRMTLLAGGDTGRIERHQTIRNTLDWSYSLLTTQEQTLLVRLSVLVGGWDLEAAEAVCNPKGEFNLLEGLGNLLDHSLVRQEGRDEPRFSMLEIFAEYSTEKLAEIGEFDHLRDLHAAHYVERVEHLAWQLAGTEVDHALAQYDMDHKNMRAALSWAVEQQRAETALRLVHGLYGYWYLRGQLAEGWLWATRALSLSGSKSPATRANALKAAGTLAVKMQEYGRARQYLQEGLTLFQREGDSGGEIDVLRQLGVIAGGEGKLEEGIQLLQRALDLSRSENNMWGTAACLDNLGSLYGGMEEPDTAAQCLRESLQVAMETGIPGIAASAACSLGEQLAAQGQWTDAEARFEEGRRLALPINFIIYVAQALEGLAYCALHDRSDERAVRLLAAASAVRERHDLPRPQLDEVLAVPEIARLQSKFPPDHWSRLWNEGSRWSLDEAAEYGLSGRSQTVVTTRTEYRHLPTADVSTELTMSPNI